MLTFGELQYVRIVQCPLKFKSSNTVPALCGKYLQMQVVQVFKWTLAVDRYNIMIPIFAHYQVSLNLSIFVQLHKSLLQHLFQVQPILPYLVYNIFLHHHRRHVVAQYMCLMSFTGLSYSCLALTKFMIYLVIFTTSVIYIYINKYKYINNLL